jgi:hypothetical protein
MVARWAYEAMAVYQFKNNEFEKQFFAFDRDRKYYAWKKDYWLKDLKVRSSDAQKMLNQPSSAQPLAHNLGILRNELTKESERIPNLKINALQSLQPGVVDARALQSIDSTLVMLDRYYVDNYNSTNDQKEMLIAELTATPEKRAAYLQMQDEHYNENLEEFVTNKNDLKKIVEANQELIQKQNPIYLDPEGGFFDAHYYAPSKQLLGKRISTLSGNILVIWLMSLGLTVLLVFDGLRKALDFLGKLSMPLISGKGRN